MGNAKIQSTISHTHRERETHTHDKREIPMIVNQIKIDHAKLYISAKSYLRSSLQSANKLIASRICFCGNHQSSSFDQMTIANGHCAVNTYARIHWRPSQMISVVFKSLIICNYWLKHIISSNYCSTSFFLDSIHPFVRWLVCFEMLTVKTSQLTERTEIMLPIQMASYAK